MSKAPQAPQASQAPKPKKSAKSAKWIASLKEDDPRQLILTLFEENERLRKEIDNIKKVNYSIKKEMDELYARIIQERYENLYEPEQDFISARAYMEQEYNNNN